jgi:hypothetical protein
LSISSTHGIPNAGRTARTATPSAPGGSFRFRAAFWASGGTGRHAGSVCVDFASRAAEASPFAVGCTLIEPSLLLCSVMSGTRCRETKGTASKGYHPSYRKGTSAACRIRRIPAGILEGAIHPWRARWLRLPVTRAALSAGSRTKKARFGIGMVLAIPTCPCEEAHSNPFWVSGHRQGR